MRHKQHNELWLSFKDGWRGRASAADYWKLCGLSIKQSFLELWTLRVWGHVATVDSFWLELFPILNTVSCSCILTWQAWKEFFFSSSEASHSTRLYSLFQYHTKGLFFIQWRKDSRGPSQVPGKGCTSLTCVLWHKSVILVGPVLPLCTFTRPQMQAHSTG